LVFAAGPAFAVPTYSIEGAPETVVEGETFIVALVLHLGENESAGHEASVAFSTPQLKAIAVLELGAPPYQLNLSPEVRSISNSVGGLVDQFEAASLDWEWPSPGGSFVVGEIEFKAGAAGTAYIVPFFHFGGAVLDNSIPTAFAYPHVEFEDAVVEVLAKPYRNRPGRRWRWR